MTLKGCGKFGPKLNANFQIRPPKIGQFFSSCRKGYKFQIWLVSLCLKGTLVEPKTFTQVLFSDTEGVWKVWGKAECWFPNQPPKNWSISFELGKRVEISNFIGFLCLKGTILEPYIFTQALFSDTEGLWNVRTKTKCCFPSEPPQNWSIFFELPKRVQISNFVDFFCLKSTLFEPQTFTQVLFSDTEGVWKVWAKTEC